MGALRSFLILLLLVAPAIVAEQYVVQKGDTLSAIADAKGTTVDDILRVNPSLRSHPDIIAIGDVINLPTPGPGGRGGTSAVISAAQWQTIFAPAGRSCEPGAAEYYSYDNFIRGMGGVLSSKLEVAAFLANVGHETGELCYINELNAAQKPYCGSWCPQHRCVPGKSYHGRGPLQLSYQCNYAAFGSAVLGDDRLLLDPDLLAADGLLGFQSAKWFWMTQGPHEELKAGKGFGSTIRAINGPVECDGKGSGAVRRRVQLFKRYCEVLGVDPGSNLDC